MIRLAILAFHSVTTGLLGGAIALTLAGVAGESWLFRLVFSAGAFLISAIMVVAMGRKTPKLPSVEICEGCGAPAVGYDAEGVPLCRKCGELEH